MTYIGDFPPCQHKFANSNGIILCELCGYVSRANTPTTFSTNTGPTNG